jgi:hypothetical protein
MPSHHLRTIVIVAVLVAMAVALGFGLAHVPNVELITLVVFISGHLMGIWTGMMVGAVSMGLFTVLNPMGMPVIPLALSQVTAMALIGMLGGATRRWIGWGRVWARMALCGFAATVFYDLVTNLVMALSLGMLGQLAKVLIAGLTFSLLHMISNTVIFAAAGPLVMRLRASGPFSSSHQMP